MPNQNLTELFFIIDRSGSMGGEKARQVISGFNSFVEEQQNSPGEAVLSVVIFDDQDPFEILVDRGALNFRLTNSNYRPRSMTPLYQACIQGIETLGRRLSEMPEEQRPGKVVFVIMTDGMENKSGRGYTKERLSGLIRQQSEQYAWNFIFLGQDIDALAEGGKAGFKAGTTAQTNSFEKALVRTSEKVKSYRATGNAERLLYSDADRQAIN